MTYLVTDIQAAAGLDLGPLAANMRRGANGAYRVTTPSGRVEHTHRADIAVLLARGYGSPNRPAISARHAAALARANRAVAAATTTLARSAPPAARPALSSRQSTEVNRLTNATMAEVIGEMLGQELRKRDARIRRLEAQAAARDPQAVRQRARQALARADSLMR